MSDLERAAEVRLVGVFGALIEGLTQDGWHVGHAAGVGNIVEAKDALEGRYGGGGDGPWPYHAIPATEVDIIEGQFEQLDPIEIAGQRNFTGGQWPLGLLSQVDGVAGEIALAHAFGAQNGKGESDDFILLLGLLVVSDV